LSASGIGALIAASANSVCKKGDTQNKRSQAARTPQSRSGCSGMNRWRGAAKPRVSTRTWGFLALDLFCPHQSMRIDAGAPLFRRLHRSGLANEAALGLASAFRLIAARDIECMVDAIEVRRNSTILNSHCTCSSAQSPWAGRGHDTQAQDIHDPVHHSRTSTVRCCGRAIGGRDHRPHMPHSSVVRSLGSIRKPATVGTLRFCGVPLG